MSNLHRQASHGESAVRFLAAGLEGPMYAGAGALQAAPPTARETHSIAPLCVPAPQQERHSAMLPWSASETEKRLPGSPKPNQTGPGLGRGLG